MLPPIQTAPPLSAPPATMTVSLDAVHPLTAEENTFSLADQNAVLLAEVDWVQAEFDEFRGKHSGCEAELARLREENEMLKESKAMLEAGKEGILVSVHSVFLDRFNTDLLLRRKRLLLSDHCMTCTRTTPQPRRPRRPLHPLTIPLSKHLPPSATCHQNYPPLVPRKKPNLPPRKPPRQHSSTSLSRTLLSPGNHSSKRSTTPARSGRSTGNGSTAIAGRKDGPRLEDMRREQGIGRMERRFRRGGGFCTCRIRRRRSR